MVTPADVLRWTGITISQDDCNEFNPVAEARINADSGNSIPNAIKTALMCYLIASYKSTQSGNNLTASESIGGYSYSQKSSSSTSVWIDLYNETISPFKSSAGKASASNGGGLVEHSVDRNIVRMNRMYNDDGVFF